MMFLPGGGIPQTLILSDGRTLLYGMDPTLTLCSICGEIISTDYNLIEIYGDLGRLMHGRCIPGVFEQELLGYDIGENHGTG